MFLNADHAQRVLGEIDKKVSIGGMGVKEISAKILELYDKICRNIAPLVQLTSAEVLLALDKVFPPALRDPARACAKTKADASRTALPAGDFPFADLQVRMRDVFRTVQMIEPGAVVAVAAALEFAESLIYQRIIQKKKPSTISRADINWVIANDSEVAAIFE